MNLYKVDDNKIIFYKCATNATNATNVINLDEIILDETNSEIIDMNEYNSKIIDILNIFEIDMRIKIIKDLYILNIIHDIFNYYTNGNNKFACLLSFHDKILIVNENNRIFYNYVQYEKENVTSLIKFYNDKYDFANDYKCSVSNIKFVTFKSEHIIDLSSSIGLLLVIILKNCMYYGFNKSFLTVLDRLHNLYNKEMYNYHPVFKFYD